MTDIDEIDIYTIVTTTVQAIIEARLAGVNDVTFAYQAELIEDYISGPYKRLVKHQLDLASTRAAITDMLKEEYERRRSEILELV